MNLEPNRKQWKKVYRLAREPDRFLSDALVLDFPVRWLILAIDCLNKRGK